MNAKQAARLEYQVAIDNLMRTSAKYGVLHEITKAVRLDVRAAREQYAAALSRQGVV